ncbi:MAG: valine--tRNA ligase [Candidatus Koribacter versatilis]|uniref:Valine--tRNA ligase n=1 Tax=Candidatus Korobacter versatilis TaxID=658062 RepID=A0A932A8U5_9BACT|nr:valine--tRNA ligase [Candidatus Koribacter versatilis]
MSHELPKAYEPGAIEQRWADYWVAEKLFATKTPAPGDPPRPVFTLLLPPPNVTGKLHMGHMLNHTEMDIIVRWHRMRGFTTLWLPGTDHAGIATQMMVERQLAAEGVKRRDMGREAFIARVWQWKQLYGWAIQQQMRRLGDSVDWEREYFTMDERLSQAVVEAFVRLHEQGLIYRGKYIVNWCPRCLTAISDLEVVHEETLGKLYEIRYALVGEKSGGGTITVATTRPETMLGDTAVAVNPTDERYTHLHGKRAIVPLINREVPIITDDWANPEFGTGAVKVTPAHDPNDFQIGLRHLLPQIDVMDEAGRINENGGPYAGHDRFEARDKIVDDLRAAGQLVSVKDHVLAIGKCDRCKTIVEPKLSTQWFVKVAPLAEKAIEAVMRNDVAFVPENYSKTYFEWMRNIHDWCISRQLWWGHRIPAWHCRDCQHIEVERTQPEKCSKCNSWKLEQDVDVLDTWFSSGLLPFTTLGWPERTRDLEVFYPTSLLITGFDILFFWVARMIMLGCHFMHGHPQGRVPFQTVYIHSLVRDAERQKMSKTKGNVLDPIEVSEKYGTDAVRFTLAAMAAPGTDIAFNESRTEGYRAFANKIWNAARFMFMNVDRAAQAGVWSLEEFQTRRIAAEFSGDAECLAGEPLSLEDRWIVSRFNQTAQQVGDALAQYRFHEAAAVVYEFFWGEFCDWYVELVKLRLGDEVASNTRRAALANLVALFEGALRLLSPFMPFITEEIWQALYDGKPPLKSIALAAYPQAAAAGQIDLPAEAEFAVLRDLIVSIRNIRAELKIETKQRAPVEIFADAATRRLFEENRLAVEKLAGVESMAFVEDSLAKAAGARSTTRFDVRMIYEKPMDVGAERERLTKELKKLETELANAHRQLGNEQFLAKAPANVVEGIRRREGELNVLIAKARAALAALR